MYIWRNKSSVNLHENMAAVSVFSCTNIATMISGQNNLLKVTMANYGWPLDRHC